MIDVVIHTCPPRSEVLAKTVASVEASDIGSAYRVECEPPGAIHFEKRLHYLRLLAEASRRAEYVLRLEDDVEVNAHILHNLTTWPALHDDDFGAGLAFVEQRLSGTLTRGGPSGDFMRRPMDSRTPWAQAVLFRSDVLQQALPYYFPELAARGYVGDRLVEGSLAFDWAILGGIGAHLGRRIYAHYPSLARCWPEARKRASGHNVRSQHVAWNFRPTWKREA